MMEVVAPETHESLKTISPWIVPERDHRAEYTAFQRAGGSLSRYDYELATAALEKLRDTGKDQIVKAFEEMIGQDHHAQFCFAEHCRKMDITIDTMPFQEALFCWLRKYTEEVPPPVIDPFVPRNKPPRSLASISANLGDPEVFNDVLLMTGCRDKSIKFMKRYWNIFWKRFVKPDEYESIHNQVLDRDERRCTVKDEDLVARMQNAVGTYVEEFSERYGGSDG